MIEPRAKRPGGTYCPDCNQLMQPEILSCASCSRLRPTSGWPVDPLLNELVGDRFRVQGILGGGGFGEVYLATHEELGGKRAIKVLRHQLCLDAALIERFFLEARALYQLNAPQLVKVEAFGRLPDGRPYMVMELATGQRLDRLVRSEGPLSPVRAIRIAREILLALAEAHDGGVLHRDLKAENVMVDSDEVLGERVKVLDLGVARVLGDARRLTAATRTLGTPEYMAPEQWRGIDDLDGRADLYSLGVLLYEMLAGDVPFPRRDGGAPAIYHRVMKGHPDPISQTRQDLPRGLEGFVFRLMARKRGGRPSNAIAALRELESIRAGMKRRA